MNNHPDRIEVDSDESGRWWIEVQHATGFTRYEIPDAEALYDQVKARIGPWLRERDEARRTIGTREYIEEGVRLDMERYGHVASWREPEYHSVHADIWDAREGK